MPTLRPYESPEAVRGLNTEPLTRGAQELGEAGRFAAREGSIRDQAFKQLGGYAQNTYNAVKQYNESQEIIHGTSAMTELEIKQTNATNAFMKTPDALDPAKQEAFRAQQQQELEQFSSSFQTQEGQRHFAEAVGRYQESQAERWTADVSNLSAKASVGAVERTTRLAQSLAELDPTQLDRAYEQVQNVYAGVLHDPNLKAQDAAGLQLKQQSDLDQVVEGAVYAYIKKDPHPDKINAIATVDKIAGPGTKYFPGATKLKEWENTAKAEAALQQSLNVAALSAATHGAQSQIAEAGNNFVMHLPTKPDGSVDVDAAKGQLDKMVQFSRNFSQQYPGAEPVLKPGEVKSLYDYMQTRASGKDGVNDPLTYTNLNAQLAGHTLTQQQVLEARNKGQINESAFQHFSNELAGAGRENPDQKELNRVRDEAFKQATGFLEPTYATKGIMVPQENEQYFEFQFNVQKKLDAYVAAGHSPHDAQEKYFNPTSPDYVFSPASLAPYQRGTKAALDASTANTIGGKPQPYAPNTSKTPRAEGETVDEHMRMLMQEGR